MGLLRMGPPPDLVLALQAQGKLEAFVETGTYLGDTAAWAAAHFPHVTTIELSATFHARARERFRDEPRVRPLGGSSAEVLRMVVPTLGAPALFWLDAHWSGLDTAGREAECPLLEELSVINAAAVTHTLLVDDARLFCAPPPRPHRQECWPDLAATVAMLSDGRRRHVVLFEDVLIAVPAASRRFLGDWLQEQTTAAWAKFGRKPWWQRWRG